VIELNLLQVAGVAVGIIVGLVILIFLVFNFDLASYLATGSETLSPTGTAVGQALVVYSPGLSGAAKESATKIAGDLKSKGYTVTLAGIRSSAAASGVDYDVVIVGGPVYFGKLSSSTGGYLGSLSLKSGAKLGIFGTTGGNQYMEVDFKSVSEQVSSLRGGANVPIKLILNGEVDADCLALVSSTLG
jgi:hypothetical protein